MPLNPKLYYAYKFVDGVMVLLESAPSLDAVEAPESGVLGWRKGSSIICAMKNQPMSVTLPDGEKLISKGKRVKLKGNWAEAVEKMKCKKRKPNYREA